MAASVPPNPNLGKSQALNQAQATVTRLATLVPSLTTELSPVTVYQPGVSGGVGNELTARYVGVNVDTSYGVWVAPDVNGDGSTWYATVECFGAGGGGGGGNSSQGGGGGGGGEYACEFQYPIEPGKSYVYVCGLPGSGGFNNSVQTLPGAAGTSGGTTAFDLAGIGLAGGVVANGGGGADQTSVGIGGDGGTGSANSVHFDGGAGGTNVSGNGSDNPLSLAQTPGMFVGNTLSTGIILDWYIMNDSNFSSATRNDATGRGHTGTWANIGKGNFETGEANPAAPAQVPAYTSVAGTYGPNQTTATWTSKFNAGSFNSQAARFACGGLTSVNGSKFTISGWVQAPQGEWGNTPTGTFAVVAANNVNYVFSTFKGFALYFFNNAGTWQLYISVGNGTTRYTVNSAAMPPTPGTWYYVVATYNAGTLSLYVNGTLASSTVTTGYTSVPAGAYATVMGMDPSANANWFFGAVSNFWFANDCLTSTGVNQAFGLTAATGGAGGGASGGPSAAGGTGASAGGATGGNGGTPATQPANLAAVTTAAGGGFAGANGGASNVTPGSPAGGIFGNGGGGSGDMVTNPGLTVLTIPFSAAVTYTGTDSSSSPGTPYNVNQQNNPNSGVNSVLYSGGLPSDTASGSKNSMLLLPVGLASQLGPSYTIVNVFLTFTNAFPQNTVESILEVGFSADTTLPQTYNGASLVNYVGAIPIPVGAGTITYDMSQTEIVTNLQSGGATALILGPGGTPTFDAYNAQAGSEFYCSIYGPGAADQFGNPEYPYLTIVFQETMTTQQGSYGSSGGILITNVSNSNTPVATIEPFATTDANGNQFAAGFTGPITAFDPTEATPGDFVPESWKTVTLPGTGSFSGTIRYKRLAESNFIVLDINVNMTTPTTAGPNAYTTGAMDSQYWPQVTRGYVIPTIHTLYGAAAFTPYILVGNTGGITFALPQYSTASNTTISATVIVPLD